MPELRTCIDRRAQPRSLSDRLALLAASQWQAGDRLFIKFLDGTPALQDRVKAAAAEWLNHARLNFVYAEPSADAVIRISFTRRGSWSMIGTQARAIVSQSDPTMNFGWLTDASTDVDVTSVVLHEFGHAIGCIHEHQHPLGGIPWNRQAVYDYYAGYPNYWTPAQVDENIFKTYSADLTHHTAAPDSKSIMMYPIDKKLTDGTFEVSFNATLSPGDISFIRTQYP